MNTDERPRRGFRDTLILIAFALGVALTAKTFFIQVFSIPSASMESTLTKGDRIVVNKLDPGPFTLQRGDVVVFQDPDHWLPPEPADTSPLPVRVAKDGLSLVGVLPDRKRQYLIKRVIGMPGDTVKGGPGKPLEVNGVPVEEPYVKAGSSPSDVAFSVKVPAGHLWVMGDNRGDSADSRYHQTDRNGGSVPLDYVVGRAFVLLWPLDHATALKTPEETFSKVGGVSGVK